MEDDMSERKPKTKAAKKRAMGQTMHEFKEGSLKSGSGHKVASRDQAIAIGLKQSGQSRGKTSAKARERRLEGKAL
jgi:hypothetical protein